MKIMQTLLVYSVKSSQNCDEGMYNWTQSTVLCPAWLAALVDQHIFIAVFFLQIPGYSTN